MAFMGLLVYTTSNPFLFQYNNSKQAMNDLDPLFSDVQAGQQIILVTNNSSYKHFNSVNNIEVVTEDTGRKEILDWYQNNPIAGLDTECNGLDPLINDVLLLGIGNKDIVYILDVVSIYNIESFILPTIKYVAHNAKYDYTILNYNCNVIIDNWYCTMIADQKIWQGCGKSVSNQMGFSFSLAALLKRRFKKYSIELDKDVRDQFIGIPKNRYTIELQHLNYLAEDIEWLIAIYDQQKYDIAKYNLEFYIDEIGRQQPWAVGDMELSGFYLDCEQWLTMIEENKTKQFQLEIDLDTEFRRLRDTILSKDEAIYIKGKKYDNNRSNYTFTQNSLFDDISPSNKNVKSTNVINWGSSDEVKYLFGRLKFELPTDDRRVPYHVPTFYKKSLKGGAKWCIDDKARKYTTKEGALEAMAIELPHSKGNSLLRILIKHRKVTKQLQTYGAGFMAKISEVTGLIHTQYRTDTAKTGRYQSGGGTMLPDKINIQNIPREKRIRNCFRGSADEFVLTADLSGAEVTIVCDFAHDKQLYEWAVINDDAHSPIAQATWRDIFWYRAGYKCGIWTNPTMFFKLQHSTYAKALLDTFSLKNTDIKADWRNAQTFEINKSVNKDLRTAFKPMTFGTIYQMKADKAGQTLNISKDEGAVGIQSIKNAIPATFAFVDSNIGKAINQGYLVLNTRTNSRIWFPELIRCYKNNEEPSWRLLSEVSGAAANAPFQGTQADMMKESIVELSYALKRLQIKATVPGMVHDELVSRFEKPLIKPTLYWCNDTVKKQLQPNKSVLQTVDISKHKDLDKYLETGDVIKCNYPEFVKNTMTNAANRYLKHYKMGCDYEVLDTWTK